MSRSVNAFEYPPFDSRIRSYSLGGTFFEPLNIMCSKKCESPVIPGCSLREPTRYHCQNATVGTLWSSCVSTTRPLSSTCRSTLKRSGLSGDAELEGAAGGADGRRFACAVENANVSAAVNIAAIHGRAERCMSPPVSVVTAGPRSVTAAWVDVICAAHANCTILTSPCVARPLERWER